MRRRALLPILAAVIAAAGIAAWCPASESDGGADALRKNMHELWRSSITAPKDPSAGVLRASIATLDGTPTSVPAKVPAPVAVVTSAPAATEPAPTVVVAPASAPAVVRIDANTLENLKKAPAQGAGGLLTLADTLFNDKELPSARALYEQALKQEPSDENKSWALFQLGNCLQDSDANAAVGFYKRVSAECPQSTWAPLAATQAKLVDWRRSVNMQATMDAGKARKDDGK